MTDDDNPIRLSRRKVLGGLGGVGLASAGAGLGTTAYFSDQESFTDNSLTAGELDLKLDYKSTYAGGPGRLEEIDALYPDFDVEEIDDGVYLTGEVPNAGDNPGGWPGAIEDWDLCDPELNLVDGEGVPVFNLEDVKPGDMGEVTISLHICDNPSWLWMSGELTENAQNGFSEPEEEALLEEYEELPEAGQLADAVDVTMWYDEDCDNVYEPGGEGEPVCVQLVLDASGSMNGTRNQQTINGAKELAERILDDGPDGSRVGVTFFSADGYDESAQVVQPLTDDLATVENAIDTLPANGDNTAIGEGIQTAQNDSLVNCGEDESPIMVVMTDGGNNAGTDPGDAADAAQGESTEIFALGAGGATESTLEEIASDPVEDHVFTSTTDEAIDQAFAQIAEVIVGETIILEGSLADVMAELEEGIPLDGNRATEQRDPFNGGVTQCLGFEWEVPADVGNEIQTDSVMFDIGLYAEQSRHNDDPTNPFNETATATETPTPTTTSTPGGNSSQS
ncbi:vWA domain-containing protein [Halolamina sediminis]|jgi:predicted ribosomally synthesized peptide with SipW-like signal peptide|uniref:vWA domain-containing protein n=1 Tax=Halolamina sediminis TaxID=1480675 RepID=UPI0006B6310A|nr:VWA domain-containing protein [Halolamina sediminis]